LCSRKTKNHEQADASKKPKSTKRAMWFEKPKQVKRAINIEKLKPAKSGHDQNELAVFSYSGLRAVGNGRDDANAKSPHARPRH